MNKSELIDNLTQRLLAEKGIELNSKDVELAVKSIIDFLGESLAQGQRIEIRGFGSFTLRNRPPRVGRNPRTGEPVNLPAKNVPHFKSGKDLRERVNEAAQKKRRDID
ncbi:MAG: integration host factor subunit beta [Methylothermaceae bacteria B42]|nr:MAG: integration host factor subunit beta [Methylothermaceae bacteria B42]HHJ37863.1 integration host factor subunit beta [Methylothermaceae bacterium]